MAPNSNSVVSLPSPLFQWLLQRSEEFRCFVIALRKNRDYKDYKHFAPADIGFCHSIDLQLLHGIKQQKPPHLSKYVSIVIDEMYIKKGFVCDKSTGTLTGYSDLGEVNNLLMAAEEKFKDPSSNLQRP